MNTVKTSSLALISALLIGTLLVPSGVSQEAGQRRTVIWKPLPEQRTAEFEKYRKEATERRSEYRRHMLEAARKSKVLRVFKLTRERPAGPDAPKAWATDYYAPGYYLTDTTVLPDPTSIESFAAQCSTLEEEDRELLERPVEPKYLLSFESKDHASMLVLVSEGFRYHIIRYPDGWHRHFHTAASEFEKSMRFVYPDLK